jgi:hypothetical protein
VYSCFKSVSEFVTEVIESVFILYIWMFPPSASYFNLDNENKSGHLNPPPAVLLGALLEIRGRFNNPKRFGGFAKHLERMDDLPGYQRPVEDRLYHADYEHKGGETCENCASDKLNVHHAMLLEKLLSITALSHQLTRP